MAENDITSRSGRREFLCRTAAMTGSFAVAGIFDAFRRNTASGAVHGTAGFGPLRPTADETTGLELLQLPEGFRYSSFGWTGDPLADGAPTPPDHDGMAVIAETDGVLTLCRNHEVTNAGRNEADPAISYDGRALGGCTNLRFDGSAGSWIDAHRSLAGTVRNCAGGPTPWGSWLSCEETVWGVGDKDEETGKPLGFEQDHGYIFEVPAERPSEAVPLKDMGRFVHEAAAVDPETGIVYETEDRNPAGFYRFLPNEKGNLRAGGRLQMLAAKGASDLRGRQIVGRSYDVSWVDIEDVSRAHSPGTSDEHGVVSQGIRAGGTTFRRLEGAWWGAGGVHFVPTHTHSGQVWFYEPKQERLTLLYESPGQDVLDGPDNITVSPRGGIVLCADGRQTPERLRGLTRSGHLFPIAANNVRLTGSGPGGLRGDFRDSEFAGATFSPDGKWLFVNIQRPGLTLAITGPWADGGI